MRAVLLTTSDPNELRSGIEQSHLRGVPVLVGCADEAQRRRAVELKAEEWFLLPATPEEIAARTWSAVARGAALGAENAKRVDQVEHEQMLHDSLTGLPTLPVAIEKSRAATSRSAASSWCCTSTSCATRRSRKFMGGRSWTPC